MLNTEHNEPMEQAETMDLATAQKVEQERITRRSALRKLGFGAGLAAFSLLGVDDFARMVGQRMERMAGDNKVATQVAREFQQAGIALASPNPSNPCPDCTPECGCACKDCTSACTCQGQICENRCPKGSAGDICRGRCGTTVTNCSLNCPPA